MISKKKIGVMATLIVCGIASVLIAGDHLDAPSTTGVSSDITSFYAFEAENPNKLVLVANLQGYLPSGGATENAEFDPEVLVEFNIDTDGDLVEDLVLQTIRQGDSMYFFGPAVPSSTGLESEVMTYASQYAVKISTGETDAEAIVAESPDGLKFFAGPRDDPFFFDLNRFNAYVNGEAPSGFNTPGTDTFAGTNVMAIVVEIPKSLLGSGAVGVNPFDPDRPTFGMWVESKRKQ